MRGALGIQATLALGLTVLLLAAGTIAAFLVVRLVATEAEADVLGAQRGRADALAALLEAACAAGDDCARSMEVALAGRRDAVRVSAAVLTRDQRVLAGRREGRAGGPLVVDVLQGAPFAAARVPRIVGHRRGPGVDHRVVRALKLRDGRRVVLTTTFSLDALHEAVAQRQRVVLLYLMCTLVAVLVFGLYLGGRALVDPIRRLTDAATDEAASVPQLEGPRELAQLSRAFADLVRRLQDRNAELAASLAALEAARDDLVRSERLATVGRLAAGVAHEVGNPLASVIGYLEYLQDDRGAAPEVQADLLDRMAAELDRIRGTIRQLLDFSRVSAAEPAVVNLREVVSSAVELVRYQRKLKDVSIEVEGEAPLVRAVAESVRQVVVNLLLNAADALEGKGRVLVRFDDAGGLARVTVADDGPGIVPEHVERLFEPFFTTKGHGEGTGLGLAICARLVDEAGGRLWLEEEGGPGATFVFTLPGVAVGRSGRSG